MRMMKPKLFQLNFKMRRSEMTTKWALAAIVLCCYSVARIKAQSAIATSSMWADQNLTITSRVDDYVIHHQRQYAANIHAMEVQLDGFKLSYEKQLAIMEQQSELLETKILEFDRHMMPLEMLDDVNKHCVQKYKAEVATLTTVSTVKTSIAECVATASQAYRRIASNAIETKYDLHNWYNKQLNSFINECKCNHPDSQLNYTICVTQVIARADSITAANQKTFNAQMQATICSGDSQTSQSLDCTFSIVTDTVSRIGVVTRLIDDCIEGKEFCPVCHPPPSMPDMSNFCETKISLDVASDMFENETIVNIFHGLNASVPCVLVDFSFYD